MGKFHGMTRYQLEPKNVSEIWHVTLAGENSLYKILTNDLVINVKNLGILFFKFSFTKTMTKWHLLFLKDKFVDINCNCKSGSYLLSLL